MPNPPNLSVIGKECESGPRILDWRRPDLPRAMSLVKWPDSLPDGDYVADSSQPGTPKTPQGVLRRGLSKLSSSSLLRLDERIGPKLLSWRPPVLRSHTEMSFVSGTTSQQPSEEIVLKRGNSRISERSFLAESDPSSKGTRETVSVSDSELEASGERCLQFEESMVRVRPPSINVVRQGLPNKIRTARFTLTTWLPLSLFYQFQRIANIYFLLIVGLVMFPWSPKDWRSKVFPFMAVLFWTALKDLHEDRQRRRDDDKENKQKASHFNFRKRTFLNSMWMDLLAGDVVKVHCDEAFPADLILLHTGGGFEAFMSTVSLDGEANLKERRPAPICETIARAAGQYASTCSDSEAEQIMHACLVSHIQIRMGSPTSAIQDVKGSIRKDGEECPLGLQNFLPRGCTLRNTEWVLGLVVYVGDETKTRMNSAKSHSKFSNMQVYLNYCIWGLLLGILILCLYSATASALKEDDFAFCCNDESWVIKLGIFLITFYHVVPMSLYVVFEMLKLLLGYQVTNDPQMRDPETGEYAMARTADLIEEMGQVNFIFSDKTGTLTRNEMVFAGCCIDGTELGDFRHLESLQGAEPEGIKNVRSILRGGQQSSGSMAPNLQWFFTCLAVCHTVQVRPRDGRSSEAHQATRSKGDSKMLGRSSSSLERPEYLGMSPDEVALVVASCEVGIVFEERRRLLNDAGSACQEVALYVEDSGEKKTFTVLHELEFSSDRKRMSIICRHKSEIYCITKGADVVMERLAVGGLSTAYKDSLKRFSIQGLRTLVVAAKKVDKGYFNKWEVEYNAALGCLDASKDKRVADKAAEMERDLKILGLTAVEDRLQDGVPEAIETLKQAGIRVWVLTGDKMETAVDIAHSCLLFRVQTQLAYAVGAESTGAALTALKLAKETLKGTLDDPTDGGLVLDGITLQYAIGDSACEDLLYALGLASRSCVCCRLTPLQKRQLVELVQRKSPSTITLAIGDGANDVPMLEGAHLGIGIRGKEGRQAVQVSDVAISQFRFLVPLLLCHGRRAYRRVAIFLCFYLYKNLALAMGDIVWMHQDKYRGRIAFPEYLSINYNFLFTSWHILFILGFDQDVPDAVANSHPELYLVGPARQLFNWIVFSRWMFYAVFHGLVSWIVPNIWFGKNEYSKEHPSQFWVGSTASFTIIVNIVMLRLLLLSESPFRLMTSILPSVLAYVMYVGVLVMLGYTSIGIDFQPNMESIPEEVFQQTDALISVVAVPAVCITVDVIFETLRQRIWPTPLDMLRNRAFT